MHKFPTKYMTFFKFFTIKLNKSFYYNIYKQRSSVFLFQDFGFLKNLLRFRIIENPFNLYFSEIFKNFIIFKSPYRCVFIDDVIDIITQDIFKSISRNSQTFCYFLSFYSQRSYPILEQSLFSERLF